MGPAAAAASAMSTVGRASDSSAFSATKGKHEPQQRYLEYLKQCLRQGRSAAEEVVEVMRQNMPTAGSGAMAAASTLALQIRAAEEQLGLAPVPVPTSVVAGWLALPTGSSNSDSPDRESGMIRDEMSNPFRREAEPHALKP